MNVQLLLADPIPAKVSEVLAGLFLTLLPGPLQPNVEVFARFAQVDALGRLSFDENQSVTMKGEVMQRFLERFGINAQSFYQFLIDEGLKNGTVVTIP